MAGRRVFLIPEPLKDGAHAALVALIGRRRPAIVFDAERFPQRKELRGDAIHELLGRDALLFRGLLDLLPVLIDAGEEEHILALEPMIARDDIGEHLLIGVPDMRARRSCNRSRW